MSQNNTIITVSDFTVPIVGEVLYNNAQVAISQEAMRRVEESYLFLKDFAAKKVIYGINTGFGPMAQWRVDDNYLNDLQYNILRSL